MTGSIRVNKGCDVYIQKTDQKNKNKLKEKEWIKSLYLERKKWTKSLYMKKRQWIRNRL